MKFTSTGDCDNRGNNKPIMCLDPFLSVLSAVEDIEYTWLGGYAVAQPGIICGELLVFYSKPAKISQNSSGLY